MLIDPYRFGSSAPELGMFIAAGANGGGGLRLMLSFDGADWNSFATPWDAAGTAISNIAFSRTERRWVAVTFSNVGDVLTSEDGETWTERSIPQNQWIDICRAEWLGLYIAVSQVPGANAVMTSSDGLTWTLQTLTGDLTAESWRCIAASEEGEYIVAGSTSGALMSSTDGVNWTERTNPLGLVVTELGAQPDSIRAVGVSGGSGTFNIYTDDGVTWNLNAHGLGSGLDGVGASDTTFIVTSPFSAIATEDNGQGAFTVRTHPGTHGWVSTAWSPELDAYATVGVGGAGNENRVITSPDSVTWTQQTTPSDVDGVGWACIVAGLQPVS